MSGQISTQLSQSHSGRGNIANLKPFPKGVSGNPGGWNTGLYHEIRKLAADRSAEAMNRVINLMHCDDPRVAFIACQTVLERGIGKPRDHSAEESAKSQVDLSALSDDERASLAMMLSKVLGFK
jgi:hypothetical protein